MGSYAPGVGETLKVTVNGELREIPAGLTVRGLIEREGLAGKACAAEVNRRLVPRREQDTRALEAGDRVELVTLVGGG